MKQDQDNYDKWCGCVLCVYAFVLVVLFIVGLIVTSSCSPKIIEKVRTEIEYRDRIVHDTATFEIPVIVEKNMTKDTSSHLENPYAKSDAVISLGLLYHSLETKPQKIFVPIEVHVTDTLYKESEVITEIKEVEKPLTWWQKFRMDSFWWLFASVLALLLWIFRKVIF